MGVVVGNLNIKTSSGVTYTDCHFDFETVKHNRGGANTNETIPGNDIRVDFDEQAIGNSLTNMFTGKPGEWVLVPEFGGDLDRFVFEPISEARGDAIGKYIESIIERWEPRVTIQTILVTGRIDTQQYDIAIVVSIPALQNKQAKFVSTLSRNQGINFIPIEPRA